MDQVDQDFGVPNPKAPVELARFEFLEELGGVKFDGQSIIYAHKEPMAAHAYSRATYTNISSSHFTWRGEKSDDGKTWSEFMVIEAERSKE
jgi:hypothetical protein